jgi:hypothetical protein
MIHGPQRIKTYLGSFSANIGKTTVPEFGSTLVSLRSFVRGLLVQEMIVWRRGSPSIPEILQPLGVEIAVFSLDAVVDI